VKTFSDQKADTRRRPALVLSLLCVIVIACLGFGYYVGDLAKFQTVNPAKESQTALRGVSDPEQLDRLLRQYPSNKTLKMVELANKDSVEIDAAARRLLNDAEPRDFLKPVDLGTYSRSDLDALRRDVKTAQNNAASVTPRYIAQLSDERAKLENDARSLDVENGTVSEFMTMIDEQHAEMITLASKVLAARAEYYNAYEQCVAVLIREFGTYKVKNGQVTFPFQSTADSFNRAVTTLTAAAKRIAELEDERTTLRRSQPNRWQSFVDHQVAAKRAA
jgi:phage FluMu protein gp41